MVSNIDPTKPISVSPTTASERANWQIAHDEISALQAASAAGPFLPEAGGTMTGALSLAGAPTAALHAAPKSYVDAAASSAVAPAWSNTGRNFVHNPLFNIQQRGAGPFTTVGYTADRWTTTALGSSFSASMIALADADRAAIADEAASSAFQCVCTGTAGAGDYVIAPIQMIERVRRLAGKTVVLSFFARATAGAPKLGIELTQNFGSGGSPSTVVQGIGAQAIPISTAWARYVTTPIVIPSSNGKTLGTNGDDNTALFMWLSAGSNYAGRASAIGQQSFTLQLWGVQLEIAAAATPLAKLDLLQDLANCQRFYQTGRLKGAGYNSGGNACIWSWALPVQMRATPSAAPSWITQTNCASSLVVPLDNGHAEAFTATTSVASWVLEGTFTLQAEL